MKKKWRLVDKSETRRPSNGTYSDWKPDLAQEAQSRCVYCAILDVDLGGPRNFHVEHLKPKSLDEFKALINDWDNLFYACPICNTFKSNTWFEAEDNDWNTIHYPDPSANNYSDLFSFHGQWFLLQGNHVVGNFLVEKFHLNRFQLIRSRRYENCFDRFRDVLPKIDDLSKKLEALVNAGTLEAFVHFRKIAMTQSQLNAILIERRDRSLYSADELRQDGK